MTLADAAVELGRRGMYVHPCRAEDKRPLTRWTESATTDADSIRALWRRWPTALIAVRTGINGLVVVDDDRKLPRPDPFFLPALTSRTRSRGWHYWMRSETPVANAVSIRPGLDVRGTNGYVIAPPSPGWEWVNDEPLGTLPELFKAKVARLNSERRSSRFDIRTDVPVGARHAYLVSYAGWIVNEKDISDVDALTDEMLDHAALVCAPWPDAEMPGVRRHLRKAACWVLEVDARGE